MAPSPSDLVEDSAGGISFDRPATWRHWVPNAHEPVNDGPLVYLSTDPLLPECAVTPGEPTNPPDAAGRACGRPLDQLSPNGVLVAWLNTRILRPIPSAGEAIVVNERPTRLQVGRPGSCVDIGADETMDVLIPSGHPGRLSNLWMVACIRGPDLATAEAQVRSMLASAVRP
jgi:hypothetical protein